MLDSLGLALGLAILLFACYLFVRAYYPTLFSGPKENFVALEPPEEERVVAPGGPNPPNVMPPAGTPPSISPEASPIDPYDDKNMEAPIHDSMRHPELSFGPGVDNSGMNKLATSGTGSARVASSESPFSPDFAQNGGSFMGSVFANDLTKDDKFATF